MNLFDRRARPRRNQPPVFAALPKESPMARYARVILALVLLLAGGCASAPSPHNRVTVVSDMDASQKQAYIHQVTSTLKIFQASARDLRHRDSGRDLGDFAVEVDRFVGRQVSPIVADSEAEKDPRTRLQIAELQLVCALVYLDLAQPRRALALMQRMERRYGHDSELLRAPLEPGDTKFANLREGIRNLKQRALNQSLELSAAPSF
jgi:hypothetical protein